MESDSLTSTLFRSTGSSMDPSYEPYVWLSVSILVAILLDYLVVRLLLDVMRPVTAYVFWVGRAGKLVSLIVWCMFVTRFWFPKYMSQVQVPASMINAVQWATIGVVVLLAVASIPRTGGAKEARDA